jgi:hypothetical protein
MAEEGDLLDVKKKARAKAPVDPAVNAALQPLMFKVYGSLYRGRFGIVPVTTGKDWAILKRLVTQYGAEMVERYLRFFLSWDGEHDPWVLENGWTIGVFFSRWNKLTQLQAPKKVKQTVCQHVPACPDLVSHSRKTLEEMRAF